MPTPNWLSLPEDIAWFSRHNVRGFFAWAPAYFPTLAMSELRAYVMASMLWDATRNATQEVDDFVRLFCKCSRSLRVFFRSLKQRLYSPATPTPPAKRSCG